MHYNQQLYLLFVANKYTSNILFLSANRVCLLVIVAQWTIMLFVLFVSAQRLESALVDNVLQLSEKLVSNNNIGMSLAFYVLDVSYWLHNSDWLTLNKGHIMTLVDSLPQCIKQAFGSVFHLYFPCQKM